MNITCFSIFVLVLLQSVEMPTYSDMEYQQHLHDDNWSRQETDYLFEMCKRFDLRFIIISDRWDREQYPSRSVEDLKERYYNICNILTKVRHSRSKDCTYELNNLALNIYQVLLLCRLEHQQAQNQKSELLMLITNG